MYSEEWINEHLIDRTQWRKELILHHKIKILQMIEDLKKEGIIYDKLDFSIQIQFMNSFYMLEKIIDDSIRMKEELKNAKTTTSQG